MGRNFVLGSRKSKLAQKQTFIVQAELQAAYPEHTFSVHFMSSGGDLNQSQALYLLGGKNLWTGELETALLRGEVDILVHSLKDVSTTFPEGCVLGGITKREDPRDSLVVKDGLEYTKLEEFPDGSVIGTSSVRRVAQLRRAFPNLSFADVRGNLGTRLAKLDDPSGPYSALILARAGLVRLDLGDRITSDIEPPNLYHSVGQGALGLEIRAGDKEVEQLLTVVGRGVVDWETEVRCRAERACLKVLEGGCSVPVGVNSSLSELKEGQETRELTLTGTVTSLDGASQILVTHTSPLPIVPSHAASLAKSDPAESARLAKTGFDEADGLGAFVARELIEHGARSILDEIDADRVSKAARAKALEAIAVQDTTTLPPAASPKSPIPGIRALAASPPPPSSPGLVAAFEVSASARKCPVINTHFISSDACPVLHPAPLNHPGHEDEETMVISPRRPGAPGLDLLNLAHRGKRAAGGGLGSPVLAKSPLLPIGHPAMVLPEGHPNPYVLSGAAGGSSSKRKAEEADGAECLRPKDAKISKVRSESESKEAQQ